MNQLYLMGIVSNRNMRDKYSEFFKEHNVHVVLSTLGMGTAHSSILNYLGLEASEKVVYLAFITKETWKTLRTELYSKLQIDLPGHGIAFLIPLSSIGGKKALHYLTTGQDYMIEEESTLQNTEYELLITIANAGHTDTIMDAARSANAPGGTVIHAKGTGAALAKKFYGITLTEEKEMIFIVVRTEQKNTIMKAIMEKAGTKTSAGGICFSLPVTSTAGLRLIPKDE